MRRPGRDLTIREALAFLCEAEVRGCEERRIQMASSASPSSPSSGPSTASTSSPSPPSTRSRSAIVQRALPRDATRRRDRRACASWSTFGQGFGTSVAVSAILGIAILTAPVTIPAAAVTTLAVGGLALTGYGTYANYQSYSAGYISKDQFDYNAGFLLGPLVVGAATDLSSKATSVTRGTFAEGGPKSPQSFITPTNSPAPVPPPGSLPPGHAVRDMGATSHYPHGYWRQYNQAGHAVDPSTGKQPGNITKAEAAAQTHVPKPPKE